MGKPLLNQAQPVLPTRSVPGFGQVGPDGKLLAGKHLSMGSMATAQTAQQQYQQQHSQQQRGSGGPTNPNHLLPPASGVPEPDGGNGGNDSNERSDDGDFNPSDFAVPLDPDEDSDEDDQSSTTPRSDFAPERPERRGGQAQAFNQQVQQRHHGFFNQVPMILAPPIQEECYFPEIVRRSGRGTRSGGAPREAPSQACSGQTEPRTDSSLNGCGESPPQGGGDGGSSGKSASSPRSLTAAGVELAGLETASTAPSMVAGN